MEIAYEERVEAQLPFEQLSSDSSNKNIVAGNHENMTPFLDHKEGVVSL